jgi:AraC-like DNA-binding protein
MPANGLYGEKFGEHLNVRAPIFFAQKHKKSLVAVTEVRSDEPERKLSEPTPREDAFIIALQLRAFPVHELWVDDTPQPAAALKAGDTSIYDLRSSQVFHINNPFHSIHFYFPREAIDAIADDAGAPHIDGLCFAPGAGNDDDVMRALTGTIRPAFERPQQANRLFVEHVALAVGTHMAHTYGAMPVGRRPARGGLAPWQEKRAREMLSAHLDGDLPLSLLAEECGLSAGHFARAFRRSVGTSPHQWLLQRRVDRATGLLRDGRSTLIEVALACGFADQSHFTRVFTRIVGVSPGAWRRRHLN